MTNNELLLAISDLLDVKLKAELQPLRNELKDLRIEIQAVRTELHTEIQTVREELHAEIQTVREELHAEIQTVRNDLGAKIRLLQLNQENVIIPRLNNIEACYTDTFKRYRDYGDKMDSVCEDVDLLKKVVMDHSEKLQKLA